MYLCIYGVFEAGNLFQTIEMKVVYLFKDVRAKIFQSIEFF